MRPAILYFMIFMCMAIEMSEEELRKREEECSRCRYYTYNWERREYICGNMKSPYCNDWVDCGMTCDAFTKK